MLEIDIEKFELFNDKTNEFTSYGPYKLQLEHSLISISKWESQWTKPFLTADEKSPSEIMSYIKHMTLNRNIPDVAYLGLSRTQIQEINDYISAPMTATWFKEGNNSPSKEVITSELIYYWMIAMNVPYEFQKWHLNRLLTLIRVCSVKSTPPKKQSFNKLAKHNTDLNRLRRARLGTKG